MILLKLINVKHLENYKLELSFNDGLKGTVDLRNKIFSDHRSIFKALQDIDYFKKFTQNRWTIEWDNGLDFAPEYLYDLIIEQKGKALSKKLQTKKEIEKL